MKTTWIMALLAIFLLGCQNMEGFGGWPSDNDGSANNEGSMNQGVKQTLQLSTDRATTNLSAEGAFNLPLPGVADDVARTLRQFGMGSYVDRVENAMNRGAEQAVAEAAPVFKQAIREMTVDNALAIITGPETAATDYFRSRTESTLRGRFSPIVQDSLKQTGFYDQYQSMLSAYNRLPLTNRPNLDLEDYVVTNSMNTLFEEIGTQEALIRADPLGQGSALIGRIFSVMGTRQQ